MQILRWPPTSNVLWHDCCCHWEVKGYVRFSAPDLGFGRGSAILSSCGRRLILRRPLPTHDNLEAFSMFLPKLQIIEMAALNENLLKAQTSSIADVCLDFSEFGVFPT